LSLSGKEAKEHNDYYMNFPILFAPEGIIKGMEYLEWYVNAFGVRGN